MLIRNKEDKQMGITCKSIGKMKSIMKKVENELLKEKQAANTKKKEKK